MPNCAAFWTTPNANAAMTATDRLSAACVAELQAWSAPDATQAALQRDYLAHLTAAADGPGWARAHRGAHLTASALIISPDGHQVVLVLHRKLQRWLQTGGHIEPGDRGLAEAARREAHEEAGLELPSPVGIARLDRHAVPCGDHLDVQFVIVADPRLTPVASDESEAVGWFGVDALPDTDDSVRALIAAAQRLL